MRRTTLNLLSQEPKTDLLCIYATEMLSNFSVKVQSYKFICARQKHTSSSSRFSFSGSLKRVGQESLRNSVLTTSKSNKSELSI